MRYYISAIDKSNIQYWMTKKNKFAWYFSDDTLSYKTLNGAQKRLAKLKQQYKLTIFERVGIVNSDEKWHD